MSQCSPNEFGSVFHRVLYMWVNAETLLHQWYCVCDWEKGNKLAVVLWNPEVKKSVIFSVSQQTWNNGYHKGQFQLQCKNKSGGLLWSQRWTTGIPLKTHSSSINVGKKSYFIEIWLSLLFIISVPSRLNNLQMSVLENGWQRISEAPGLILTLSFLDSSAEWEHCSYVGI